MSRAKQEVKKEVHIDGCTIQWVQDIKLLGVILDVNLQFLEQFIILSKFAPKQAEELACYLD